MEEYIAFTETINSMLEEHFLETADIELAGDCRNSYLAAA